MKDMANAVEIVAELMALSARTAPKARGVDSLVIKVATGDDLKKLAEELRRLMDKLNVSFFGRDAGNIENSDACLLIGCKGDDVAGLNCGACGYSLCVKMLEAQKERAGKGKTLQGPNCAIKMADLGIALGSAAKTASIHNADSRIMYSVAVAALSLGWMEGCNVAYAIPVKASGKSIYFDRPVK
ncbi:MAG TPA: DUF2148 domain-containing protein [Methanotrichaceae archaeon]|nr:DUF2148 domain-containing protein [Methanotrichaceae archaeon]